MPDWLVWITLRFVVSFQAHHRRHSVVRTSVTCFRWPRRPTEKSPILFRKWVECFLRTLLLKPRCRRNRLLPMKPTPKLQCASTSGQNCSLKTCIQNYNVTSLMRKSMIQHSVLEHYKYVIFRQCDLPGFTHLQYNKEKKFCRLCFSQTVIELLGADIFRDVYRKITEEPTFFWYNKWRRVDCVKSGIVR
jgi:hypothetical protein